MGAGGAAIDTPENRMTARRKSSFMKGFRDRMPHGGRRL
jgi:hypothetical protein